MHASAPLLAYTKGLTVGPQWKFTTRAVGLEKYQLRSIMVGAVPTMKRLCREGRAESALCPCCHQEEESEEHMFLMCPAHTHIRHAEVRAEVWQHLPECLKLHGLVPQNLGLSKEDTLDLAGRIQYTLVDILKHRGTFMPVELQPRARWDETQRRVRPRTSA